MRRGSLWIGHALETAAILQQLAWHAIQQETEPIGNIFVAHAGVYLGAFLGAIGAWVSLRDPRWRAAALVLLLGALVRFVAALADATAHSRGLDAIPMHDAYRIGILIGVGGAAIGALAIARSSLRPAASA